MGASLRFEGAGAAAGDPGAVTAVEVDGVSSQLPEQTCGGVAALSHLAVHDANSVSVRTSTRSAPAPIEHQLVVDPSFDTIKHTH